VGKEVEGFFHKTQLFTQCVSMLYAEKSVLRYYVWFSQIRSHLITLIADCDLGFFLTFKPVIQKIGSGIKCIITSSRFLAFACLV